MNIEVAYRIKHRYLAFSILSPAVLPMHEIKDAIERSIIALHGTYGLSKIMPEIIQYDQEDLSGVVRCNRDQVLPLRASMANITIVNGNPVALLVLRVSGTLQALRAGLEKDRRLGNRA